VGIPIFAFYTFLIIIFFAFIGGLFFIALLMGICCLRFSKKKIYSGLSKLALAMMLVFFLFISNPLYWPDQIARHIDTSRFIQPNDPAVQGLKSRLGAYLNDINMTYTQFYQKSNDTQLQIMTNFTLERVVIYHSIPEVYGVLDYTASASEAIAHGKGDCQSITVVMVSFFLFLNYDAWACETPYHWYTCVFLGPNHTDPHFYYRQNWTDPEIMMNNSTKVYTMNFFQRLGDIAFGRRFYDKIEELFTIYVPETIYFLWPLLITIGFLMSFAIRSTADEKKNYLKNGILASIILIAGFFLALCFSQVFFPQLFIYQIVFIIMASSVVLAAQAIHSNVGGRLFSKKL